MANSITAYTPEIWARESIRILHETMQMPRLVRRDFSAELAEAGEVVNTRKPAKFGTADDVPTDGSDMSVSDISATNVAVTLNKHKHKTFKVTSREASKSFLNLVEIFLEPNMLSLANAVDRDLLALYADIAPTYTSASAGDIQAAFNSCRVKLNRQLAPEQGRVAVLSDDDEGRLSNTNLLIQVNTSGSSETLRNGTVGRFKGFNVFRSSNVHAAGSPSQRYNLLFHPDAFALVSRIPANATPDTPGARIATQSDPDIGVGLRTTISFAHLKSFATLVSCDILYGVKTLDTNLAVVLRGQG